MKNKSNTVSQKENDKFLATKCKDMEFYNVTDREFRTAVMKKLNELQENSGRQLNELGIKLMKRSTLPKGYNFQTEPNKF